MASSFEYTTRTILGVEELFDLSRSIDAHKESMAQSREKAVAGITSGLISLEGGGDLAGLALRTMRANQTATTGQNLWPSAGNSVAIYGQFFMAANSQDPVPVLRAFAAVSG